jgi:hypothetical protein
MLHVAARPAAGVLDRIQSPSPLRLAMAPFLLATAMFSTAIRARSLQWAIDSPKLLAALNAGPLELRMHGGLSLQGVA